MEEELKNKLRDVQKNASTGEEYNKQVMFAQVETIFAIDALENEIERLSKVVKDSNAQSEKLEKSNYTLQIIMLILTGITTIIAVKPVVKEILTYFSQFVPTITITAFFISFLTTTLSGLVGLLVALSTKRLSEKQVVMFRDNLEIKDSLSLFHTKNKKL